MKRQTERLIKEMVRRIVERFSPEKLILFGSYARGTAEFDWRKEVVGTIEWPAAREGKVLYAKT